MSRSRLSVALFCALLASGAFQSMAPSCGRNVTASGPICCKNEATCPMHTKSSDGLGFNDCRRDDRVESSITVMHRAVLTSVIGVAQVPQHKSKFETTTASFPWASAVPLTPPPRVG